ncbi:MAG: hypothetical protein GY839_07755 [candidate division Zixibacteria bacterium]|nr:hypothetical protein [candidate division Zixibacteria bacterium]
MNNILKQLVLLLILSIYSCNASGDSFIRYYRHIDIEGREPVIGMYEINSEIAERVNCYRFTYDKEERLSKVEFLKDMKLAANPFNGVAVIITEYFNDYELRKYQDEQGNSVCTNWGVYRTKRIIDSNKNIVLTINMDSSNNCIRDSNDVAQYYSMLNESGLPISYCHFDENGDTLECIYGTFKVKNIYDDKGNIIEAHLYGKDGILKPDARFGGSILKGEFDNDGYKIESRICNSQGLLKNTDDEDYAITRSKYFANGSLAQISYYKSNEKLVYRVVYNELGGFIETWMPISKWIKQDYGATGVDLVRHKYKNNEIEEVAYFDIDENPKERKDTGAAVERYIHNENKEIIGYNLKNEIVFRK